MRISAAVLRIIILSCVLLVAASFQQAAAQVQPRADVPPILISGMEAYKPGSPEDAVKAWVKGGPLEGNKVALSQADALRDAQAFYGNFQWFDIISNRELSDRTRIIYLTMNYEKGPLFARFTLYRTDQGWVTTGFDFNADDTKILPPTME